MTAVVVVHLLENGRIPCRNRRPEEVEKAIEVTEWPEYVTCNASCGRRAKEEMIRADRQRVAVASSGRLTMGLDGIEAVVSVVGQSSRIEVLALDASAGSVDLTLAESRALRRLLERAEGRGELMLGRIEHIKRYEAPGAPADPTFCQHAAIRAHLEHFTCWTCGGSWPATEDGIRQAAEAAAGKAATA